MDEQPAQINVAAFADAEQLGLAAGRVLSWDQAEPGGELASLAKRRLRSSELNLSALEIQPQRQLDLPLGSQADGVGDGCVQLLTRLQ